MFRGYPRPSAAGRCSRHASPRGSNSRAVQLQTIRNEAHAFAIVPLVMFTAARRYSAAWTNGRLASTVVFSSAPSALVSSGVSEA